MRIEKGVQKRLEQVGIVGQNDNNNSKLRSQFYHRFGNLFLVVAKKHILLFGTCLHHDPFLHHLLDLLVESIIEHNLQLESNGGMEF
ncbi:uncharacterized protein DS421_16g538020 [Arachis hypogaea]|nr:uncharacterized protein DS421_16g538020 [Arachis hypogaea]